MSQKRRTNPNHQQKLPNSGNNNLFFKQIGDSSEVDFHVDFELKNKILNLLMNKSFDLGLIKIADAFQKRADELFNKT